MPSEFLSCLDQTKTILEILGLLLGAFLFAFVFLQFSPTLHLRILPTWIDHQQVILRIEVENRSRVRVKKEFVRLQVLEYPVDGQTSLSEWVPFTVEATIQGEQPPFWKDPTEIFTSTRFVYPGELLSIERLYKLNNQNSFLHVGLRFKSKSISHIFRFKVLGRAEQWTSTVFVFPRIQS